MEQNVDISFAVLSNQTCVHCKLPVTCAPVHVVNDLNITCGRCQTLVKDHYRNLPYEALASMFQYPCKNWKHHCSMKLQWNESLQHEPECNYEGCCLFMCRHPGAFFKGERDIPHDAPQWVVVPDRLLSYLECSLCSGYLNCSPVFLKSDSQNICHRCVYANGNPHDGRRNLAYENFSQYLLFSCSYKIHGCPERLPFGSEIWKHESQCEFNSHHKKNREQVTRTQNVEDQKQPNGKRYKEKGVIKTAAGSHIWATITPQQAAQAAQEDVIKDLNRKQRRRVDELENDMNGRRTSDCESISTNGSYPATKSSNHSNSSEFLSPRRTYESPRRSNSDYSRSDSRDSGQTTKYPAGQMVYTQQPARRPPSPDYYDPPPGPRSQFPNHLVDPYDEIRRSSYRESFKRDSAIGNHMLISELKIRQDHIKRTHSIKGNGVPYRPNGHTSNMNGIREDYVRVG